MTIDHTSTEDAIVEAAILWLKYYPGSGLATKSS